MLGQCGADFFQQLLGADAVVITPRAQNPTGVSLSAWRAEALRAGSIRRAAQHLGLGQPQLTRQIAQIERSLGIQVAERGASGLALTAAGARFVVSRMLAGQPDALPAASGE